MYGAAWSADYMSLTPEDAVNINYGRAILAGIVGTAVMTVVAMAAPMMGMPPMNPADMLAAQMGGNVMLGWLGHFMVGTILAIIYAAVAPFLPGAPWQRGALYSLAPWLLAQVVVMPMMGMGLFSGSMLAAGGSLLGHLIYGATVGAIYGMPGAPRTAAV